MTSRDLWVACGGTRLPTVEGNNEAVRQAFERYLKELEERVASTVSQATIWSGGILYESYAELPLDSYRHGQMDRLISVLRQKLRGVEVEVVWYRLHRMDGRPEYRVSIAAPVDPNVDTVMIGANVYTSEYTSRAGHAQ